VVEQAREAGALRDVFGFVLNAVRPRRCGCDSRCPLDNANDAVVEVGAQTVARPARQLRNSST
jgi:hypothetical protein